MVNHLILLKVLQKKFGTEGKFLSWFDTYVRPRHCKVNIGSVFFLEHELQCSVPQGSCAGPVAYVAYASTLQEVIPSDIPLHGFEDDHLVKKAFTAGWQNNNKEKEAIEDLENVVKNINTWEDINRLKMDYGKTEFAFFGSRQHLAKYISDGMKVNDTRIDKSEVI